MPLVDGFRAGGHDDLPVLLSGKVDDRQIRLLLGMGQGAQAEQGGEQGAHGGMLGSP